MLLISWVESICNLDQEFFQKHWALVSWILKININSFMNNIIPHNLYNQFDSLVIKSWKEVRATSNVSRVSISTANAHRQEQHQILNSSVRTSPRERTGKSMWTFYHGGPASSIWSTPRSSPSSSMEKSCVWFSMDFSKTTTRLLITRFTRSGV